MMRSNEMGLLLLPITQFTSRCLSAVTGVALSSMLKASSIVLWSGPSGVCLEMLDDGERERERERFNSPWGKANQLDLSLVISPHQ